LAVGFPNTWSHAHYNIKRISSDCSVGAVVIDCVMPTQEEALQYAAGSLQ